MERGALKVEGLATLASSLLTSAQGTEAEVRLKFFKNI